MALRILILSLAVLIWVLAAAPISSAVDDKLAAPGARAGQETTVTVGPDDEAGARGRPSIDILGNGKVTCGSLRMRGAIFAPVVGHVTFRTVGFEDCAYLGKSADLNTASCEIEITSGGLGILANRKGGRCDLRVEVPGCLIHLGKGPFLEVGYHNVGSPPEATGLTEPVPIGGTAIGVGCLSPGPYAIGQYKGYLRLWASRDGAKKPFVISF